MDFPATKHKRLSYTKTNRFEERLRLFLLESKCLSIFSLGCSILSVKPSNQNKTIYLLSGLQHLVSEAKQDSYEGEMKLVVITHCASLHQSTLHSQIQIKNWLEGAFSLDQISLVSGDSNHQPHTISLI
jgi:hypothetical protein